MAGKLNKYLSYGIEMDLDLVCGKIDVDADGRHIRRTYIDRETLAKCSGRSLIETVEFIAYGNKSLIDYLDMIAAEVRRSISAEFEDSHITYAKNTYRGAWITGDGAIILRCCADWMVDIKTPDSSNSVDDVALLIKNAIERAINGSEISVKHKILY
jgi:hypothetical protein